jgi:hypothetical protein
MNVPHDHLATPRDRDPLVPRPRRGPWTPLCAALRVCLGAVRPASLSRVESTFRRARDTTYRIAIGHLDWRERCTAHTTVDTGVHTNTHNATSHVDRMRWCVLCVLSLHPGHLESADTPVHTHTHIHAAHRTRTLTHLPTHTHTHAHARAQAHAHNAHSAAAVLPLDGLFAATHACC